MTQHATKQMPCRKCGEPITVGIRTKNQPRHIMCGVEEMQDAIRQMHDKSGPYYDRWVAGQVLYLQRLTGATPGGVASPGGSDEN